MLFSSFEFLFRFLPVFLVIYYLTPKKFRNVTLLGGSIVFYTIGEAGYITILLACVLVNYTLTRLMYRKSTDGRGIRQKRLLLLALGYDLGVLFFFKYSGLASGLPLGISFYTFQIMAYVIDVYRGRIPAEQSLLRLGTYLTMFPQLISGPITNYADVRVALGRERTIKARQLEEGMKLLIIGLAAKVVIADRIGTLWNSIQMIGFDSISTKLAWMGAFAYSLQLYFDFAGYSMMARGIGKMLGFELPVNFRYPYISKSVTEFWRRWHITLGRWFREYVYIPLGGNRKGKARTFFNLFVVWSLTALWHGADWHYAAWGIYYGMIIIASSLLAPVYEKLTKLLRIKTDCFSYKLFQIVRTFLIVLVGYVLFRGNGLMAAFKMIRSMFTVYNPWVLTDGTLMTLGLDAANWNVLILSMLILLAVSIANENGINVRERISQQNIIFQWICYLAGIFAVLIFGIYGSEYFRYPFIVFLSG